MTALRLDPDSALPLLRARAGDVPARVIVVGDPARAERVADRLFDPSELGRNREYVMFRGLYAGAEVGVASHGVGSAGAAVCLEELCRAGARRILRAGTTGGLQPHVRDGMLVIATGAVRDEGLTPRLVPLPFPALASVDAVVALRSAAAAAGAGPTMLAEGIVVSGDLFYPHDVLGHDLELWSKAGAVSVEMECSALFVTCALHGVETGAILAVDGNPLLSKDDDMSGYDPHRTVVDDAVNTMIGIALDAVTAPLAK